MNVPPAVGSYSTRIHGDPRGFRRPSLKTVFGITKAKKTLEEGTWGSPPP